MRQVLAHNRQASDAAAPWRRLYRLLGRRRYQLLGGIVLAVLLPTFLRWGFDLRGWMLTEQVNTILGSSVAVVLTILFLRPLGALPGVQANYYILPVSALMFGMVLLVFFLGRIEYNRFLLPLSFALSVAWLYTVHLSTSRVRRPHFLVLPGPDLSKVLGIREADWTVLEAPGPPPKDHAAVVANLNADLGDEWERYLTDCALAGTRVFHLKDVAESLTGRVEIEHISENTLGSLNPDSIYLELKQWADWCAALAALVLLLPLLGVVALAIKLDTPGPVLFRQQRVGFRGALIWCFKFRTMRHEDSGTELEDREAAMTRPDDPRITRLGKFLRRTRIDELPQLINVLRGEMSLIGPRPEAVALSKWYETELPFYRYRHIVRPGISGWAQVNQGHVSAVGDVLEKLHYDFYYIKHFSLWLDLLIVFRTIKTVLTGKGAH